MPTLQLHSVSDLAALCLAACLEDQHGATEDTSAPGADTASDTSTPDQSDTTLSGPSGTVRLAALLLGAFHTQGCLDVAVSNRDTSLWSRGYPATTRSGGDQRLAPQRPCPLSDRARPRPSASPTPPRTSHVPDRELFTADRPTADGLVYPFFRMKVPVTRSGELVCETSTLDDHRFVDVELYGTTGQREALPPRCVRAQGETLTATNAPGCAD